jgi:hypothetical protein
MITDPGRGIKNLSSVNRNSRIGIETGPENSVACRRLELERWNGSSWMSSARC